MKLHHVVILAVDADHLHRSSEDLERIIELDTLTKGDIGVRCAVSEEEGGMDLVGTEERAVLGIEIRIIPRITIGTGNRAVSDAPGALSPVGGERTDAGMADGAGKEIRLGEEILGHKASVAGTKAADPLAIDIGVTVDKALRRSDDLISGPVPPGIDMPGGILLSPADGSAGIEHQHDIVLCGIHRLRVVPVKHPPHRRCPAIVVHEERVLFLRVKGRRQIEAPRDLTTIRHGEAPVLHASHLQLLHPL